ncbi:MAG: hypothetical protein Kow0029_09930 [Candidatus Rifleibacteriota bacterium]
MVFFFLQTVSISRSRKILPSSEKGSSTCLSGRNGVAKTTLLEILFGLLQPDRGEVKILGLDPFEDAAELRQKVVFVSESDHLYPGMTAIELESFLSPLYQNWSPEVLRLKLQEFKLDPNTKMKNHSKGNRHKLLLAAALAAQPEVMIQDEPLAGLEEEIQFKPSSDNILASSSIGKRLELIAKNCPDENISEFLKGLKIKTAQSQKVSLKDIFLSISKD